MRHTPWPVFVLAVASCAGEPGPSPLDAATPLDASADAVDVPPAPPTGPARATVRHYDYDLDVTTDATRAALTLEVTQAGDCLTVPCRLTAVESVSVDGAPARDVSLADGALRLCAPEGTGWSLGARLTVETRATLPRATWRPTQVGYSVRRDREGHDFTYLQSWVGQCDRAGPCDNDPSVFATYRFTVTHPKGTTVLCPGTITPGAGSTVCEFTHDGGPTYSTFAVMVGQSWTPVDLGTASGVRLTLYDLPSSGIAAAIDPARLRAFVSWMSATFGPYPYGDALRLVAVPLYWAGFEHPGNIAISENLARGRAEHTILHEIAHQWAGDQTTLASVDDFVWKEATAEYLAFTFEREQGPASAATATLQVWRDASSALRQHPIPSAPVPLVDFYGSAYGPGPMVLYRQLEAYSSRAQVLEGIRAVLGRPRALSVDDLRESLERSTGQSLATYLPGWLRGEGAPTWPTVRVARDGDAGPWTVTYDPRGASRGCRFTVRFEGAEGQSAEARFDIATDGAGERSHTVTTDFAVARVLIDPDHEALVFPDPGNPSFARVALAPPATPWLSP
ncbi:MAG: M1 family aminopeptidase [Polyangiales bacterium]